MLRILRSRVDPECFYVFRVVVVQAMGFAMSLLWWESTTLSSLRSASAGNLAEIQPNPICKILSSSWDVEGRENVEICWTWEKRRNERSLAGLAPCRFWHHVSSQKFRQCRWLLKLKGLQWILAEAEWNRESQWVSALAAGGARGEFEAKSGFFEQRVRHKRSLVRFDLHMKLDRQHVVILDRVGSVCELMTPANSEPSKRESPSCKCGVQTHPPLHDAESHGFCVWILRLCSLVLAGCASTKTAHGPSAGHGRLYSFCSGTCTWQQARLSTEINSKLSLTMILRAWKTTFRLDLRYSIFDSFWFDSNR